MSATTRQSKSPTQQVVSPTATKIGKSGIARPVPRCPGTSAAVKILTTPGMARASAVSNGQNFGPRVRAQRRCRVQHARDAHVVDEGPLTERLLEAAIARQGVADRRLRACHSGCRAPRVLSEIFAEIGMAARFSARQVLAVLPGFAGGLNGVDNSRVAGAAAEMAGERLRDGLAIIGAPLSQPWKMRGPRIPGMQKPHCTPPSSTKASPNTRRMSSGMPSSVTTSWPSICSGLRRQASTGRPSTRTAQQPQAAFGGAAVLGGNDAALLAQDFEEVHPRLVGDSGRLAIQGKVGCRAHGLLDTSVSVAVSECQLWGSPPAAKTAGVTGATCE